MITLERPPTTARLLRRTTRGGVRVFSAVALTLGAAAIHLAVAPVHVREYLPFGLFFLGVGSAQIILGVEFCLRPTRQLALSMAAANVAMIGLWLASRIVGLPIGPNQPEAAGLTDIVCAVLEVSATMLFLALAVWPARRVVRRLWLIALGSVPSAIFTLGLTSLAVAATLSGMPAAASAAPPQSGTTSIATLTEARGDEPVKRFTLTAAVTTINGQEAWAFNGSVPGPELRVAQGDRVLVTLINQLPESTTLHWHGVQLPNAEDGVAGVTQDAVQPGATFTYEFVAREPGTYWYHSHQQTESQLPKGLFGPLVVMPADGSIQASRDYVLTLHGSAGNVAINGEPNALHLDALAGETVRLRLVNAVDPGMDGGPETPVLVGAAYQVVALDGRDLNAPTSLGPTRIPLGMGQRADLVFTMPPAGGVELIDTELSGAASPVQALLFASKERHFARVVIGSAQDLGATAAASAPLFDAYHYGAPAVDLVASAPADLSSQIILAEHPGIRAGRPQLIHTINNQAAPDVAPIVVQEGQTVRLHIVNATGEYHPMHLHGHVFSVISVNGEPISGSPLHLDSVLVGPNQSVDVAFVANNPGVWMFHCHILLHAGMGMIMSLNYAGYSTPFEMGTSSGNMPE